MKAVAASIILSCFILTACAPAPAVATSAPEPTAVPATEAPTVIAPTEQPIAHKPTYQVIYDFQELYCQAKWTNNGQELPCPADDYTTSAAGVVSIANETDMESVTLVGDAALLTWPAHDGSFRGIFGTYPPIMLQEGDRFEATIGCMGVTTAGDECSVEYSLEYIDENGNYVDSSMTGWHWTETNDGVLHDIFVSFNGFGGRELRLVLVVRDEGDPTDDTALWLHPQLLRVVAP